MAEEYNELSGNPESPLLMQMMEDLPGLSTAVGAAHYRSTNTLLKGRI